MSRAMSRALPSADATTGPAAPPRPAASAGRTAPGPSNRDPRRAHRVRPGCAESARRAGGWYPAAGGDQVRRGDGDTAARDGAGHRRDRDDRRGRDDCCRPAGDGACPADGRTAQRWRRRDRGSASIEFLGFLPILILVALAAVQLGIAAYAVQQAGTAARAAARTGSLDEPGTSPGAAGTAAISGWLADGTNISDGSCAGGEARATATVKIPSVFPGFDGFGSAKRSATMPCDDGQLQAGGQP